MFESRVGEQTGIIMNANDVTAISASAGDAVIFDEFIKSPLTRSLVVEKESYYLAQWTKLFGKSKSNIKLAKRALSWHWPALFVPILWLAYRKMYAEALIVGVISLLLPMIFFAVGLFGLSSLFFTLGFVVAFGVNILISLYANALYFRRTFLKWKSLESRPDTEEREFEVRNAGGVSLFAAVISYAIYIAATMALPRIIRMMAGY